MPENSPERIESKHFEQASREAETQRPEEVAKTAVSEIERSSETVMSQAETRLATANDTIALPRDQLGEIFNRLGIAEKMGAVKRKINTLVEDAREQLAKIMEKPEASFDTVSSALGQLRYYDPYVSRRSRRELKTNLALVNTHTELIGAGLRDEKTFENALFSIQNALEIQEFGEKKVRKNLDMAKIWAVLENNLDAMEKGLVSGYDAKHSTAFSKLEKFSFHPSIFLLH